ncbi:uncharacterized protein [Watersipora subatra]|uniref:uncharacterized protein n=1 Tax=Watersipora subatra TaxID=2589382 RepID=UPI00355C0EE0
MNKLLIITLLAVVVGLVASQNVRGNRRGGGQRRAQGGRASANSLQAGEKNLDAQEALLQKKQAKQARLDRRAARQERKKAKAAKAEAARLKAENAVNFETFEKEAEFNNLEAAASVDSGNKFGLQLFTNNHHKENAAISKSEGSQFASGTKLASENFLNTEFYDREEALVEDEFLDVDELSAAGTDEDLLNAKEASRVEHEQFIDAENAAQASGQFGETRSQGGGFFGSNNIFGSSPFGTFGSFKRR